MSVGSLADPDFQLRAFRTGDLTEGWTEESIESPEGFNPGEMSLLQRRNDCAHFVVVSEEVDPLALQGFCLYTWTREGGWTSRELDLPRERRDAPWLHMNATDAWLTWRISRSGRSGVAVARLIETTSDWSVSIDHEITFPDRNVYLPHVAVDDAGNVHVVALSNHPFGAVDLVYTVRDAGTGVWSPMRQVNDVQGEVNPQGKLTVSMVASGDGDVWMAYRSYGTGFFSPVVKVVAAADAAPTYDIFAWTEPRAAAQPMRLGDDRIGFFGSRSGRASVALYDVGGRRLGALERNVTPGLTLFSMSEVAVRPTPGVYWWRLRTPDGADPHVIKTVILR